MTDLINSTAALAPQQRGPNSKASAATARLAPQQQLEGLTVADGRSCLWNAAVSISLLRQQTSNNVAPSHTNCPLLPIGVAEGRWSPPVWSVGERRKESQYRRFTHPGGGLESTQSACLCAVGGTCRRGSLKPIRKPWNRKVSMLDC